jgi:hypothetical protein
MKGNPIIWPWMEADRSVSLRRCMAILFGFCAPVLLYIGFQYISVGWIAFMPGTICILAVLILAFFTTWADITELIKAAFRGGGPTQGITG